MSIIRNKVNKIIDELGIEQPTDITHNLIPLCMHRGAYVREGKMKGAEGRILITGNKAVIFVNSEEVYVARKSFSIAHELGHFELHKNQIVTETCTMHDMNEWFGKQDRIKREIEANEFAIELLMPAKFVEPLIKNQVPSISLIESLADRFQTSFSAAAKRYIELTDECCALAFFNRNGIRYHIQAENFKSQQYWIASGPLNDETYAYNLVYGKNRNVPDRLSMVSASGWLDISNKKDWQIQKINEGTILEHSLYFENLNFGISLLWLKDKDLIWA